MQAMDDILKGIGIVLMLLGTLFIKLFGEESSVTICSMYVGFLLFCFGMLIKGMAMLKEKDLLLGESARKADHGITYFRMFVVSILMIAVLLLLFVKLLHLSWFIQQGCICFIRNRCSRLNI